MGWSRTGSGFKTFPNAQIFQEQLSSDWNIPASWTLIPGMTTKVDGDSGFYRNVFFFEIEIVNNPGGNTLVGFELRQSLNGSPLGAFDWLASNKSVNTGDRITVAITSFLQEYDHGDTLAIEAQESPLAGGSQVLDINTGSGWELTGPEFAVGFGNVNTVRLF